MKKLVFTAKTQKSVKITALLLLSFLLLTLFNGCVKIPDSYGEGGVMLSQLSEKDCIRFVLSRGVVIPEELKDDPDLRSFVKELITMIEEYPHYVPRADTAKREFAKQINEAVNEYYGYADMPNSFAQDNVTLSQLSEKDCIRFIQSKGVVIPEQITHKIELGDLIKTRIIRLEENPEYGGGNSWTVLNDFLKQITIVINEYYGVTD